MLNDEQILNLEVKANEIRQSVVDILGDAGSGHTAGSLGMADIFTYLYFHELKHDPGDPSWSERDRLILSNGHICPVLYASLAYAGYFDVEELRTLRRFGSRLQGHPHREFLPFVDTSSGPLGSGLSQAAGMALADRLEGKDKERFVYCLMGDGELNEGNIWEAAMFVSKYKLRNLISIIDRNNIQIDGFTEDVMPLESLKDKWRAFGFHVLEISGHDFGAIDGAIKAAKTVYEKPTIIIAHTVPGKGVKEFERDFRWHGKAPNKEEELRALKELRTLGGKIKSGV